MKVTEQDKRDIKEIIMWLNEAGEWCGNMPPEFADDEHDTVKNGKWLDNVLDALDAGMEWLQKIERGEIK